MADRPFPVEVTDGAAEVLRRMLAKATAPSVFVRVGVKGGGCSGLEYVVKLDDREIPGDVRWVAEGVTVVCDPKSAEFLEGSRLVASGNLIGGGLTFENPNAARSCGCGTSFLPKG